MTNAANRGRFLKGQKGGPGRPKGRRDGITMDAKKALEQAFEGIGGTEALMQWARNNQTDFYKLWSRIIPKEITGENGGPIRTEHSVRVSVDARRVVQLITGRAVDPGHAVVVQDRPLLAAEVRNEPG